MEQRRGAQQESQASNNLLKVFQEVEGQVHEYKLRGDSRSWTPTGVSWTIVAAGNALSTDPMKIWFTYEVPAGAEPQFLDIKQIHVLNGDCR